MSTASLRSSRSARDIALMSLLRQHPRSPFEVIEGVYDAAMGDQEITSQALEGLESESGESPAATAKRLVALKSAQAELEAEIRSAAVGDQTQSDLFASKIVNLANAADLVPLDNPASPDSIATFDELSDHTGSREDLLRGANVPPRSPPRNQKLLPPSSNPALTPIRNPSKSSLRKDPSYSSGPAKEDDSRAGALVQGESGPDYKRLFQEQQQQQKELHRMLLLQQQQQQQQHDYYAQGPGGYDQQSQYDSPPVPYLPAPRRTPQPPPPKGNTLSAYKRRRQFAGDGIVGSEMQTGRGPRVSQKSLTENAMVYGRVPTTPRARPLARLPHRRSRPNSAGSSLTRGSDDMPPVSPVVSRYPSSSLLLPQIGGHHTPRRPDERLPSSAQLLMMENSSSSTRTLGRQKSTVSFADDVAGGDSDSELEDEILWKPQRPILSPRAPREPSTTPNVVPDRIVHQPWIHPPETGPRGEHDEAWINTGIANHDAEVNMMYSFDWTQHPSRTSLRTPSVRKVELRRVRESQKKWGGPIWGAGNKPRRSMAEKQKSKKKLSDKVKIENVPYAMRCAMHAEASRQRGIDPLSHNASKRTLLPKRVTVRDVKRFHKYQERKRENIGETKARRALDSRSYDHMRDPAVQRKSRTNVYHHAHNSFAGLAPSDDCTKSFTPWRVNSRTLFNWDA